MYGHGLYQARTSVTRFLVVKKTYFGTPGMVIKHKQSSTLAATHDQTDDNTLPLMDKFHTILRNSFGFFYGFPSLVSVLRDCFGFLYGLPSLVLFLRISFGLSNVECPDLGVPIDNAQLSGIGKNFEEQ